MSENWDGGWSHGGQTEVVDLDQASNSAAETREIRDSVETRMRELGYAKSTIDAFRAITQVGAEVEDDSIADDARDFLLELFEENDITTSADLTRLGVGRDVRNGLRILASFELRDHEDAGSLQSYLDTIPSEDHPRVENGVVRSVRMLLDNAVPSDTTRVERAPRQVRSVGSAAVQNIDGVMVRNHRQSPKQPERSEIEFPRMPKQVAPVARERAPRPAPVAIEREEVIEPQGPSLAEFAWNNFYEGLPENVSVKWLAKFLTAPEEWVKSRLVYVRASEGKRAGAYPKSVIHNLYSDLQQVPAAEGWVTPQFVIQAVDMPKKWVMAAIADSKFRMKWRRTDESGDVMKHVKEDVITYLLEKKLEGNAPEAGDWVSSDEISELIPSRSYPWVTGQLKQYADQSENRVGISGRARLHYPPSVAEELRALVEREDSVPEKGDNLVLTDIAKALGKQSLYVTQLLQGAGIVAEPRRIFRRIMDTYPQSTIETLRAFDAEQIANRVPLTNEEIWEQLPDAIKPARLASMLDTTKKWVVAQLESMGLSANEEGEYDKQAIDLETLRQQIPGAPEDWMSVSQLINFTGKSRGWLQNRLDNIQGEQRMTRTGATEHYPVYVADLLKAEAEAEETILPKGDNLTLSELAEIMRRPIETVRELLEDAGVEAEPRRKAHTGQIIDTYPIDAIGYIKDFERAPEEETMAQMAIGSLRSQIHLLQKLDKLSNKMSDVGVAENPEVESLRVQLRAATQLFNDITNNRYA